MGTDEPDRQHDPDTLSFLAPLVGFKSRKAAQLCAYFANKKQRGRAAETRSSLRAGRAIPGGQSNGLRVGAAYSQPSVSRINQPRNTT
jgi:hypothetical protein